MRVGKAVVAVLDDELKVRSALARLLRTHGFEVEIFETGEQFLSVEPDRSLDCLLLDLQMPGITGYDVLGALMSRRTGPPVVVITGRDEPGNAERVLKLGASSYLLKPVDESVLLEAIHRATHPTSSNSTLGLK